MKRFFQVVFFLVILTAVSSVPALAVYDAFLREKETEAREAPESEATINPDDYFRQKDIKNPQAPTSLGTEGRGIIGPLGTDARDQIEPGTDF